MVEAGVGNEVIPESAAIRDGRTMNLAILSLEEPWVVRERSIMVRDIDALPGCVKTQINLLQSDH